MNEPSALQPDAELGAELDEFANAHHLAIRACALDRAPEFPWSEFGAMGKARLLGLHVPSEHGGRGFSLRQTGSALHRLAYLAGTTFAKLSLQPEFSSVVLEQGTGAMREAEFRPLMRGERLVANQITEPEAGSDARGIRMTAERRGDGYLLTGTKSQAAFSRDAQSAVVYARTGTESGPTAISAFLVPQEQPGIERVRIPDLGEHWMGRGTVRYREVPVAAEQRIGEEGRGFEYLARELTRERALLAAIYLGVGRSAWEATVAHAGERQAFGRPLSANQAVSFPLTEDWARLDAAELYVRETLGRLDRGEPVDGRAALAKWMATEVALFALDHAIQFHGGRGYSSELPFERCWRDVRSGAIAHGPSEIMHVVAARSLWPKRAEAPSSR